MFIKFFIILFVSATCGPALAHTGGGGVLGGFVAGYSHPLFGIDHMLAMLAVGMWGAQLGGRAVWVLPVAFPMLMALGGAAAILGMTLSHVELGIAGSVVVLGLAVALVVGAALGIVAVKIGSAPPWRSAAVFGAMIAFGGLAAMRLRLPWPAAGALGLACGIWQGALGTVPPFQGGTGDWTATQTIVAAVLAPLVGYQLAMRARAMRAQWPRVVVRVAASWIAAAGILLLAFTLRL